MEKLLLFLFAVMVSMSSGGEMSYVDFQLAINWLCDISKHHGDQWLLNHTTDAVRCSLCLLIIIHYVSV